MGEACSGATPFTIDVEASVFAGQTPSRAGVLEMEDLLALSEASATNTEQGEGLVAQTCRIQCPVTLDVHASTLGAFQTSTFPGTLSILTGHAALCGWYNAMYKALILPDDNATVVAALWQAAMTVSIKGSSRHVQADARHGPVTLRLPPGADKIRFHRVPGS